KIHTYPGERVGNDGIIELGQTREMLAVAEIYQSDVDKVRLGQPAKITSDSFQGELLGNVEYIGLQVLRQNIVNTDPSANIDARIVEVKVRLDAVSSRKVAGLTNLQVKVAIGGS
ncbi:MAG: HlyD family secretion protein, partial [Microcoleus sp.]